MDEILGDLKLTSVLVYLDDINVFSWTFDEHLEHLAEVFRRLLVANLKLKPKNVILKPLVIDYFHITSFFVRLDFLNIFYL